MPKVTKDDSLTCADIAKREDISAQQGLTEYGRVEFADPKNHKYPLDTEEHVRAAASYWGRPENKSKYSKEDQEKISKRIQAAERRFKVGSQKPVK